MTAGTSIRRSMRSISGPGDAGLVIGGAAVDPAALAGIAGLIGMAAAAGIHRRDQHEARGIGDAVIGAGHRDLAVLHGLAQRIQHARIELRQFVEEQHALMRQRNLAGFCAHAAAGQRRHAGGMMRASGTAAARSARRRGFRRRRRRSSRLPEVPTATAAAGSRAAVPPASICRRRASRSSTYDYLNGKMKFLPYDFRLRQSKHLWVPYRAWDPIRDFIRI